MCINDVMDKSIQDGRRIRGLQHVSFAYKSTNPADIMTGSFSNLAHIVDVVGFAHGCESILDTTIYNWIQDSRVIDQNWTPVQSIKNLKYNLEPSTSPEALGLVEKPRYWS
jgi:hypothetical protein